MVLGFVTFVISGLLPSLAQAHFESSHIRDLTYRAIESMDKIAPSAFLVRAVGTRSSNADCIEGAEWDFQFIDPTLKIEEGYTLGYSVRFTLEAGQCESAKVILPTKARIVTRERLDWNRTVPGLGETRKFHPAQLIGLADVQKSIQVRRPLSAWTRAELKNREGGLKPNGIFFAVTSDEAQSGQNQAMVDAYTGELTGLWDYDPQNR